MVGHALYERVPYGSHPVSEGRFDPIRRLEKWIAAECLKSCPIGEAICVEQDDFSVYFIIKCRVALTLTVFIGQFSKRAARPRNISAVMNRVYPCFPRRVYRRYDPIRKWYGRMETPRKNQDVLCLPVKLVDVHFSAGGIISYGKAPVNAPGHLLS